MTETGVDDNFTNVLDSPIEAALRMIVMSRGDTRTFFQTLKYCTSPLAPLGQVKIKGA